MSTKLSVNVNKLATLRNARGGNNPDVLQSSLALVRMGAEGITVHPRPDERHIRRQDVYEIAAAIPVEFNIEGYPTEDFLRMVEEVKPAQVTFVPDAPGVLTSNAGWDTLKQGSFLKEIVSRMKEAGVRTSLFSWTDPRLVEAAANTGTHRIELYTEAYASAYETDRDKAVAPYVEAARIAIEAGLGLNAGHDLSLLNLKFFRQQVPGLLEVSIGHALICDALWMGMENTVHRYLSCLRED